MVKVVLLGAVANVSYPPFPPSGSVLLVLPHCFELAISDSQLVRVVVTVNPKCGT